jgi:hypothetical protein
VREHIGPESGLERLITVRNGLVVVIEVRCIWDGKRWTTKVERLSDGSFASSTGTILRTWGERQGTLDKALDQLPPHVQASWRALFIASRITVEKIRQLGFVHYKVIVE